jgi:tol-pal system protein YbgF
MSKFHLYLFGALCLITAPASAGLFNDDEARKQILQLEARLAISEESLSKLDAAYKQQANVLKQQTSSLLDLQTSIEALNTELRKQRGQNEDLAHNLQDAEKRQKDLYADLDGRLRRFEAGDTATADKASGKKIKTDDPITENRALEAAFGFYRAERYQNAISAFQEFLSNYPQSAHTANIRYWMGNANFMLKDYKASLASYQILVSKFDTHPKIAEAMLNIADCQELLNDKEAARATLKQVMAKFPNSEASGKAKKHLSALR